MSATHNVNLIASNLSAIAVSCFCLPIDTWISLQNFDFDSVARLLLGKRDDSVARLLLGKEG